MLYKIKQSHKYDDLYDHLLAKDMSNFWKTWSRKICKNIISADAIDGHTGNVEISDIFKNKFNANYVPERCPTPPDAEGIVSCPGKFPSKLSIMLFIST